MSKSTQKPDVFRSAVVQMFRDIGFTKERAKKLYPEVEKVLIEQLANGELRIKGVIAVGIYGNTEKCWDNFKGKLIGDRVVVRGGCRIRPRLKERFLQVWEAKRKAASDEAKRKAASDEEPDSSV